MLTDREVKMEDLDRVSALEASVFFFFFSREGFAASLSGPDGMFLIVEEEETVIGYCGMIVSVEEGEITNVAVDPAARRKGAGDMLIREAIRRAQAKGIGRIVLEVRVSNHAAIHLYEKNGFVTVGTRKGFYEKPREDALVMIYGQ